MKLDWATISEMREHRRTRINRSSQLVQACPSPKKSQLWTSVETLAAELMARHLQSVEQQRPKAQMATFSGRWLLLGGMYFPLSVLLAAFPF